MWNVLSYNGFVLSNASYRAYLTDDNNPSLLPTVTASLIKRGERAPDISLIERQADQLVVTVQILASDWRTALNDLLGACHNRSTETAALVVVDNTGAQWHVAAKPIQVLRETSSRSRTFEIPFLVPDRIWRKTASSVLWNISSSPATQVVTNDGNASSYPLIKIKPTTARGGGFLYRQFVSIINVVNAPLVNRGFNLASTVVDTRPWVADSSISNQINQVGGITAVATTIPIDTAVGGGLPSRGMGYLDTEQISWTSNSGSQLTGVTRGIGGTTAATHADNTVIKNSYMKADASDLRLYKDGLEQDLWVRSPNTANTKLWTIISLATPISLTCEAIPSGSITTITFQMTSPNTTALNNLPASGILKFDSEYFTYSGKNTTKRQVTVTARAAKDSSAASHSAGTSGKWIQHDYWLFSGDPTAEARINDDTRKPMFDLDASTNASRTYYEFWDAAGLRADRWQPLVFSTSYPVEKGTRCYSGNHLDEGADPATDPGIWMQSIYKNARWNAENGNASVRLNDPCGIENVDWDADRYIVGTSWPSVAALQKSKDGNTWTIQVTATKPTATSTWQTFTPAVQTLGTGYTFIEVRLSGSITGGNTSGVGYQAALETDTLTYTVVNPPTVTIGTRNAASYELACRLENSTSGDAIELRFTLAMNTELEIDCDNKVVTYLADGQTYRSALYKDEDQDNWLTVEPGNNTFTYTEQGVSGVDVTFDYDHMLVA